MFIKRLILFLIIIGSRLRQQNFNVCILRNIWKIPIYSLDSYLHRQEPTIPRVSAWAFFGHKFWDNWGHLLTLCRLVHMFILHKDKKSRIMLKSKFYMAISKILDFNADSKFAIRLPEDMRGYGESQNCDWVLFSVTRF